MSGSLGGRQCILYCHLKTMYNSFNQSQQETFNHIRLTLYRIKNEQEILNNYIQRPMHPHDYLQAHQPQIDILNMSILPKYSHISGSLAVLALILRKLPHIIAMRHSDHINHKMLIRFIMIFPTQFNYSPPDNSSFKYYL